MIHIIPDFATHKNWIINKCKGVASFNDQFCNIIDYVARATLASIPEFKQRPLIITFHRVYPRQMKSLSGEYRTLFCRRKGPLPAEFRAHYKLGSIYICTAALEKEANGKVADYFTRIVMRGILELAGIQNLDKENEILRLFK